MAFSASLVLEVETGGSTSNGGGFDPGLSGITFNTDLAATSATGTAPVVTSASFNFTSTQNNMWLYIPTGTGGGYKPGWYKITSTASNAATINATAGQWYNPDGSQGIGNGCAATASPSGGSWTIDYSQTGSALLTITDGVIGATNTQATSALTPFDVSMIGNVVNWTSGTGWIVQRVGIVSVSMVTATFSSSLGTAASTGGHGIAAGALSDPSLAFTVITAAYQTIFIKSGTYTITTRFGSQSGGVLNYTGTNSIRVTGYSTNRHHSNTDTQPIIKAGVSLTSATLVQLTTSQRFYNFTVDTTSGSSVNAISNAAATVLNCTTQNLASGCYGIQNQSGGVGINCLNLTSASNSSGAFEISSAGAFYFCVCDGNAGIGFRYTGGPYGTVSHCLARNLTGTNGYGFQYVTLASNCYAYNCAHDGFAGDNLAQYCINCVAVGNGGYGFNYSSNSQQIALVNCAGYNNASGNYPTTPPFVNLNFKACTSDPATSSSGGNFLPNATASAGALLTGAAYPSSLVGLSTNNYGTIGVVESGTGGAGGGGEMVQAAMTGGIVG